MSPLPLSLSLRSLTRSRGSAHLRALACLSLLACGGAAPLTETEATETEAAETQAETEATAPTEDRWEYWADETWVLVVQRRGASSRVSLKTRDDHGRSACVGMNVLETSEAWECWIPWRDASLRFSGQLEEGELLLRVVARRGESAEAILPAGALQLRAVDPIDLIAPETIARYLAEGEGEPGAYAFDEASLGQLVRDMRGRFKGPLGNARAFLWRAIEAAKASCTRGVAAGAPLERACVTSAVARAERQRVAQEEEESGAYFEERKLRLEPARDARFWAVWDWGLSNHLSLHFSEDGQSFALAVWDSVYHRSETVDHRCEGAWQEEGWSRWRCGCQEVALLREEGLILARLFEDGERDTRSGDGLFTLLPLGDIWSANVARLERESRLSEGEGLVGALEMIWAQEPTERERQIALWATALRRGAERYSARHGEVALDIHRDSNISERLLLGALMRCIEEAGPQRGLAQDEELSEDERDALLGALRACAETVDEAWIDEVFSEESARSFVDPALGCR